MKVLITGATGLIGSALAAQLGSRGHCVVHTARQLGGHEGPQRSLSVDFAHPPPPEWWVPHLSGVDRVVNAVGIFQENAQASFDAVHTRAPVALFQAAADAGVPWVIQLSALGADDRAETRFHASKRAADEALRQLPVKSVVVQPSLVYDPQGESAQLFNRLAVLPLIALPASQALVQPVHLQDVVDGLVRLIENPPAQSCTVHAVGPQALTLKHYVLALRKALGASRRPLVLEVPLPLVRWGARLLSATVPQGVSLVHPDALSMLARGNSADPSGFAQWLGRAARPVSAFLREGERGTARERAQWSNLLAAMRASVATVWIATGVLSLGLYPAAQSLQLLGDFGLHGAWAWGALYLGAVLDLALGLLMLLAPRRWLPAVYRAQILLILAYTALITLRIPQWWLHPFAPILKNLPMLVGTAILATLDRRR